MSVMKLEPVYKCRYCGCGEALKVAHLSTTHPDTSTEVLGRLMAGLPKIALCPWHLGKYNWYASQGRTEEFERMASGVGLLLAVHDPEKDYENAVSETS